MNPYIPQLRVLVDWDGDGFINKGVPVGTPTNKAPYAAYPRALALRKFDGTYVNRFLFGDRYALVAREVEVDADEDVLFGTDFSSFFNPTAYPNILNSYKTSTLTISGSQFVDDYGRYGFDARHATPNVSSFSMGGNSGQAQIPLVSGQAYTLLFKKVASGNLTVNIYNASNVLRHTTSITGDGQKYYQFTAAATENVRITIATSGGGTFRTLCTEFMLVKGTVTSPPDGYNIRDCSEMDNISPIVLAPSQAYTMQFIAKSTVTADAAIKVYRHTVGTSSYEVIYDDVIGLTADTDYKFQLSIPSDTDATYLYGTISLDSPATLSLRGYAIYEGTTFYPFSVGDTAAYDEVNRDSRVLSLNWEFGRRKFDEPIGYEGTAEITLNNQTRMFSPENTASPLYDKLGRKNLLAAIEVQSPTTLEWHRLFTGWTELIDVVVGTRSNLQARLTLRQGMFRLREGNFSPIVLEEYTINEAIPFLLEMAGWRYASHPAQAVLDYEQRIGYDAFLPTTTDVYEREETSLYRYDLIGEGWDDDTKISSALEDLLEAEGASFWLGREGKLNFVARTFYLHRPEVIDYSLTLDTLHEATYEFGRDVATVVSVYAKPKDTSKNQIVWTSRPAIVVNSGETVETKMSFAFEGGEPRTITALSDNITLSGYRTTKDRFKTPEEVSASVLEKVEARIEKDYYGGYTLVLKNNFKDRLWITAEVRGDYVVGGEGVTYEFSDTEAMLAANGIHRRNITTFLLTNSEEAEGLAETVFLRDGKPDGEFTSFKLVSSTYETVDSLIAMQTGDRLYVTEYQTAEADKAHVILGEAGSFDGRSLQIKYNVGRIDPTIYAKVGDTIGHELVDVVVGEDTFIGSGEVSYGYRLDSDELVKVITNYQGVLGTYMRGTDPVINVNGETIVYNPDWGLYYGSSVSSKGNFPKVLEDRKFNFEVVGGMPYRFRCYVQNTGGAETVKIGANWNNGDFVSAVTEGSPSTNSASFTPTISSIWNIVDGYFLAQHSGLNKSVQPLPLLTIDNASGRSFYGSLQYWPKYPLTYLKPSTSYTLHVALRLTAAYTQDDMVARVVEVAPPPYVSGDGDTTLATVSFTPTANSVGFYSVTFTTSSTPNPVRIELEFTTVQDAPRSYELYEFALVEGSSAPTELGTLATINPNVARLAV